MKILEKLYLHETYYMMKNRKKIKKCSLFLVSFLLTACATQNTDSTASEVVAESVDNARERTRSGLEDAALQPLNDLNLRKVPIPALLKNMPTPYYSFPVGCGQISHEVSQLTLILGDDIDIHIERDDDLTISEEAGEEISDTALDTIRDVSTSPIPFRSLVRRATGAKAYDKKVRRAYERGLQRRAFLKGVGLASGCLPPAAPWPHISRTKKPSIEYRKTVPE